MLQPGEPSEQLDLAFAGLAGQAQLIAAGQVSSRELVELALDRIEATQDSLNCFRVIRAEEALNEAAAADASAKSAAPLRGVPIAIKDDVDLGGYSTPFGCPGDYPAAREDAEMVRRLRAAGAILVGKTNAPEVGQWHFSESPTFGATRNPWHTDHTPGGSSGGAAAAVAAGLIPAAIGSDGAGSVRIPAAWTHLLGLKPQRGRISTWPDAEAFNGLTCFGPLARSVDDLALLLDVAAGNHPCDTHQPPVPAQTFRAAVAAAPVKLRVGISFATPLGVTGKVHEEIRSATEAMARRIEALGHQVIEADPSYGLVGLGIVPRGMAGVHGWLEENAPEDGALEPRTRAHAQLGRLLSGPPLATARAGERAMAARIARIYDRVDVLLTPTTAQPPPRIGALDGRGYWKTSTTASAICPFAWAWNVTGWPALNLPAGFTTAGLPIGVQLLGRENDEATLLALAAQLEQADPEAWTPRPPLTA